MNDLTLVKALKAYELILKPARKDVHPKERFDETHKKSLYKKFKEVKIS